MFEKELGRGGRKLLAEVLAKEDRLLVLTKDERMVVMLVRLRGGQAKVVGLAY
jgi:hypothetical protein